MATVRLTSGRISSFKVESGKKEAFLWDTDTVGLGVKVTSNGRKTYVFQSKIKGTNTEPRITIGTVDAWKLEEVRRKALEFLKLCQSGISPKSVKEKQASVSNELAAELTRQTIKGIDAFYNYIDQHKDAWGKDHLADHYKVAKAGGEQFKYNINKKTQPGILRAVLEKPLVELNSEIIEEWLKTESLTRPTQAALAYRLFRGFVNWCLDTPEYKDLVVREVYSARKIKKAYKNPKPSQGSLQKEQLELFFSVLREEPNIIGAAYLQSVILTGLRRDADASLKWSDVDFRWKSIRVWDKVTRTYRLIPLTPYIEYLLLGLPRYNEYIFSSKRSETGYIAEPRTVLERCLQRAGLPHVNIHDLRRTFSNMCEWIELPPGVKNQLMGHKPKTTDEKHYTNRPLDLLRQWHIKIESWMMTQAKLENEYRQILTGLESFRNKPQSQPVAIGCPDSQLNGLHG